MQKYLHYKNLLYLCGLKNLDECYALYYSTVE